MPVFELIFDNPLIVISMAIGGLILLATAGITLFMVIRNQIRRQKHRAGLARVIEASVYIDEDADDLDDTLPAPPLPRAELTQRIQANVAAKAEKAPKPEKTEAAAPVNPPDTPAAPVADAEPVTDETAEEEENTVSGTMQDILSDVFVNEDVARRYAVLMKDQSPLHAADVVDLTRSLMARLAQTKPQPGTAKNAKKRGE